MQDTDDEFEAFNLSEFSSAELFSIDDAVDAVLLAEIAGPRIQVTLEGPDQRAPVIEATHTNLLDRFRRKRLLSVTDLIGPAWYAHIISGD